MMTRDGLLGHAFGSKKGGEGVKWCRYIDSSPPSIHWIGHWGLPRAVWAVLACCCGDVIDRGIEVQSLTTGAMRDVLASFCALHGHGRRRARHLSNSQRRSVRTGTQSITHGSWLLDRPRAGSNSKAVEARTI